MAQQTIDASDTLNDGRGKINTNFTELYNSGSGYTVYTALLAQTGTDTPVATVLKNTLGGLPVWAYVSPGNYTITLSGAFPDAGKVWAVVGNVARENINLAYQDANSIAMYVERITASVAALDTEYELIYTPVDDVFVNLPIEIRVYP